ncbi:MAG: response regulator [Actinomycetota bacterium]
MRILLIDEDASTIELCRLAFESERHDLRAAPADRDAIRAAVAPHVDAIILDSASTGIRDGEDLIEMLRSIEGARATPFVVLTARARLEDEIRAWERGSDAFVRKPFSPVGLIDVVVAVADMTPKERCVRRNAMLRRVRAVHDRVAWAREERRMHAGLGSLTPVERRVANLVVEGVRLKPACARLGVAEGTYWAHKGAIRRKLSVPRNEPLESFLRRLGSPSECQRVG